MTTPEKIGQMLMVRYPDRSILEAMLQEGTAGAYYFRMKGISAEEVAGTLNRLQAVAKVPALVAFGSATTNGGAGLLRGSQMRLGATRSPELAYLVAYREACEQRAYGVHIIDSPCLDPIRRTAATGRQIVLLVFGNPYVLQGLPRAHITLCAYDHDSPESIEATVAALFGEAAAPGRLPVSIPGAYRYGSGG